MDRNAAIEARRYAVLMSRYKSVLKSELDDRSFAVRIRIRVEGGGLRCLDDVHTYLREAGPFAIHSALGGIYIYADKPKVITDCIEKFDLRLLSYIKNTS
jgi:hypothetical protein